MTRFLILALLCALTTSSLLVNKGTWTADLENQFSTMTIEELRQYTGTFLPHLELPKIDIDISDLPINFNASEKWPECIGAIRNQGKCGSCWAFGAAETFSDRACIATSGKLNLTFSPQELVSCDTMNFGCGGGFLPKAWDFILTNGLVSESCFPYTASTGVAPKCQTNCSDSETWKNYKAKNVLTFTSKGAKAALFNDGPLETAFNVYEDFFSYKSGIYVQNSTEYVGGHAIKVVGWGHDEETDLDYWIAANSWGTTWGMNGFFKIAAGECEFEQSFIAGQFDKHSIDM